MDAVPAESGHDEAAPVFAEAGAAELYGELLLSERVRLINPHTVHSTAPQ
jgi:hypothetical protein